MKVGFKRVKLYRYVFIMIDFRGCVNIMCTLSLTSYCTRIKYPAENLGTFMLTLATADFTYAKIKSNNQSIINALIWSSSG